MPRALVSTIAKHNSRIYPQALIALIVILPCWSRRFSKINQRLQCNVTADQDAS